MQRWRTERLKCFCRLRSDIVYNPDKHSCGRGFKWQTHRAKKSILITRDLHSWVCRCSEIDSLIRSLREKVLRRSWRKWVISVSPALLCSPKDGLFCVGKMQLLGFFFFGIHAASNGLKRIYLLYIFGLKRHPGNIFLQNSTWHLTLPETRAPWQ